VLKACSDERTASAAPTAYDLDWNLSPARPDRRLMRENIQCNLRINLSSLCE